MIDVDSLAPVPIDNMGGLISVVDGADVPHGASPDCRDVQFFPGNVRTRPGLNLLHTLTPGTRVPYLVTYTTPDLVSRLLMWDSSGRMWKETVAPAHILISSTFAPNAIYASVTAFGREWIVESDGIRGISLPTVYDDVNLYVIGNQPPVSAPTIVDGAAGNIIAGVRQVVVYFESAAGALSTPSPIGTWTAAGGFKAHVTGIPVWPGTLGERPVVARRLAFTGADGATFYHLVSVMRIPDNVTTVFDVDFLEVELLASEDISSLFRNLIPTALTDFQGQLGVGFYDTRLLFWGGNPPFGDPFRASLVRWSDPEAPEQFDNVFGLMNVAEDDGQGIKAGFNLRTRYYFVKDNSMHSTQDDGINPPSKWSVEVESPKIGTPSVHGVGIGEDWVVIAHRSGLYFFNGGEPIKISQEIQPTWDSINWLYGHNLWVKVDVDKRRLYVGAPWCSSIYPNMILMCDYQEGLMVDPLANSGQGRKWSPWFIRANFGNFIRRPNLDDRFLIGMADGTGMVHENINVKLSDNGAAINSYYRTAYLSRPEAGRQLFGYFTCLARGDGNLTMATIRQGGAITAWNAMVLESPATKDLEKMIDVQCERVSTKLGTNAIDKWYSIAKLTVWVMEHPFAKHRGTNT